MKNKGNKHQSNHLIAESMGQHNNNNITVDGSINHVTATKKPPRKMPRRFENPVNIVKEKANSMSPLKFNPISLPYLNSGNGGEDQKE